jgi:hypothetical protein
MPQRSLLDMTCSNEKEERSSPKRKKSEKTILGLSFGKHEDASYIILEEY